MEDIKELIKYSESLCTLFGDLTRQYEKSKSLKVAMLSNGENVIYKTVKLNELEYSFMKELLNKISPEK